MQPQQMIDWTKCTPKAKAELIVKYYDPSGTSAAQLAKRLHKAHGIIVSRNAIIGTYGRMPELRVNYPLNGGRTKGSARPKADHQNTAKSPTLQAELERRAREKQQAREAAARIREEQRQARAQSTDTKIVEHREFMERRSERMEEYHRQHVNLHVTLMELEPGMCKWPIGSKDFVFCGVDEGRSHISPYCTFHSKLAYNPK